MINVIFSNLLIKVDAANPFFQKLSTMNNYGWPDLGTTEDVSSGDGMKCDEIFGIDPFYIQIGNLLISWFF